MAHRVSLNRRHFVAAGALALVGCGGEVEHSPDEETPVQNPATGTPPWHMWGNKKTVTAAFTSLLAPAQITTEQLANIQGKRPDTWRFFFAATLVGFAPPVGAGLDIVTVDFDLQFGIGLATQTVRSFASFQFEPATDVGNLIWTSRAIGPKRTPTDAVDNTMTELVAQTIQCNARCQVNGAQLGTAQLEIASYFAPNVHVRPDWFIQHFSGELGGR